MFLKIFDSVYVNLFDLLQTEMCAFKTHMLKL